jgi:multidrug efflux system membrane fusion protein
VWLTDTDAKGTATAKIQPVKIALAEGQVTILDSGLQAGQNVVVDGADRLRSGQIVTVSTARQRSGQGAGGQGSGQGAGQPGAFGGPFAPVGASPQAGTQPGAGAASGKGSGEPNKERQ